MKLPRYAAAGVPEVWIFDLEEGRIEVYCDPSPDGYGVSSGSGPGEEVHSRNVEGLSVAVDEILG